MLKESESLLLRIFIGESDKYDGKTLYQYLVEFLRKNHFSGVTVLRGITGFGKASKIRSSDLLEISSDLPIIIEIVDSADNIQELKKIFSCTDMLGSALITEEKIKVIRYGTD
ncbi:MAG: DUF190 domain-containing protein [Bacteroidetes bacterium]|nr:DUF190 domain-containing protein [Bacteroidota bacterium]